MEKRKAMDTALSNLSEREIESQKNTSAFIHLSTFLKYFFPFANYIAPLVIWTFNKDKPFVDEHGKQAINFQLSLLVYSIVLFLICLPFIIIFTTDIISLVQNIDDFSEFSVNNIQNLSGYILLFGLAMIIFFAFFIFEIYAVINASIHAFKGKHYKYPLSVSFIKTDIK